MGNALINNNPSLFLFLRNMHRKLMKILRRLLFMVNPPSPSITYSAVPVPTSNVTDVMDFPEFLAGLNTWDEGEEPEEKKQEQRGEECVCGENGACGTSRRERDRGRELRRVVKSADTAQLTALLRCVVCWPDRLLQGALKVVETEEVVRAFAAAAPAFFWDRGHGAGALVWAATTGHVKAVQALLSAGLQADAEVPWTTARALPAACLRRHAPCVQVLLEHGADPTSRCRDGLTPLHMAAEGGELRCVEALLRWGVDAAAVDDEGATPLHYAAGRGEADCVRALLDGGADPGARNNCGHTPLHFASRYYFCGAVPYEYQYPKLHTDRNYVGCVSELVKRGAEINAVDESGRTPLYCAVAEDDLEVIKLLLDSGADLHYRDTEGETLLHCAATNCTAEVVKELCGRGLAVDERDPAGVTPLIVAFETGRMDAVRQLLLLGADVRARDNEGRSVLHCAASVNGEAVQEALDAGAEIAWTTQEGLTPLHVAASNSCHDCAVKLLEAGAEVDARTIDGKTPLHMAATTWITEILDELLMRGADLRAKDSGGWNAMHTAASVGSSTCVEFLLRRGLTLRDRTNDGQTPLHLAAAGMQAWCISYMLLRLRAPVNVRDHVGRTALHVAARSTDEETVRALLAAGADRTARDADGDRPDDLAVSNSVRGIIRRWALAA